MLVNKKIRLGFLASGSGSSVEELVKKIRSGVLEGYYEECIVCNKPLVDGEPGIYERAERLRIPIVTSSDAVEQLRIFQEAGVDLILGLGYLKPVGKELLEVYDKKIWNIHPALLPKYGGRGMYGVHVHEAVIAAGEKETGATVHLMNEKYDEGDILNQVRVPVFRGETVERLQKRVLRFEYELMATTLGLFRDDLLPNCRRSELEN